jgi:hypothetical protein
VDFATAQSFYDGWVNVHTNDFESMCGKGRGGWQSDIAEAQNADFLKVHSGSLSPLSFPQL